jgi:hypothetical protein
MEGVDERVDAGMLGRSQEPPRQLRQLGGHLSTFPIAMLEALDGAPVLVCDIRRRGPLEGHARDE